MKRKSLLPELLSPAGTPEAFYAAVHAGADAVYCGMTAFSARAYAGNFDEDALRTAVAYAHLRGVKVYITLNTQIYDREIPDFLATARTAYSVGADAVIVADMGAVRLLREAFPDLPLHASTQMSVHSTAGTYPLAQMGITRVVPARELSLSNICSMVEGSPCEIEVFVHGALCVSHSGQCLMSAMIGGRSGNRGACAQPCRLPYGEGKYPLSLKDLSLARHIPALIRSGVASLKIEGRMKSAAYVYGVTRIYRRLLDEHRAATPEEERELSALFSRTGFTDGYFTGKTESGMTGIRREEDKATAPTLAVEKTQPERIPITGELVLQKAKKAKLTLHCKGKTAVVYGETPTLAKSAPLTEDSLRERMTKLGGTLFTMRTEDLAVALDPGLFLPVGAQNDLRRRAAMTLISTGRLPSGSVPPSLAPKAQVPAEPIGIFYTAEGLTAAQESPLSLRFLLLSEMPRTKICPDGVLLPPVVFDSEEQTVMSALRAARERGAVYAMCENLAHFHLAEEAGLLPWGGFRLNIRNRESYETYQRIFSIRNAVLSPELTFPQCRDIGGGMIVYGRIPLMLLERCFIRENFSCDACKRAVLTDRTGAKFPLMRVEAHRNLLLNSLPTYAKEKQKDLLRAGLSPVFLFTVESPEEVRAVLLAWAEGEELPYRVRRVGISPLKGTPTDKKDSFDKH